MGILIKNGTIVTAVDEYTADILVVGEKITAVGNNVDGRAEEVMDATGLYVLPGGVDQCLNLASAFPPQHHEVYLGLTHKAESRIV
jgi:dihydropyrimidinase